MVVKCHFFFDLCSYTHGLDCSFVDQLQCIVPHHVLVTLFNDHTTMPRVSSVRVNLFGVNLWQLCNDPKTPVNLQLSHKLQ